MQQALPPHPATEPKPPGRWFGRLLRRLLIGVLILAIILAGLALALVVRLGFGPVSFGFLAPYIERVIDDDSRDLRFSFEGGAIAWRDRGPDLQSRVNPGLELRLRGVSLHDGQGRQLLTVPQAAVGLSTRALKDFEIAPSYLAVEGLRLRVNWREGDIFDAFQGGDGGALGPLIESLLEPGRQGGPAGYLRRVIVRNAEVHFEESITGSDWTLGDATIELRRRADELNLEAAGSFRRAGLAESRVTLTGRHVMATGESRIALAFSDLNLSVLAGGSELLARFSELDLTWSGEVAVDLSAERTVRSVAFDLASGGGSVRLPDLYDDPVDLEAASIRGTYVPEDERVTVDAAELCFAGAVIAGDGLFWATDAGPGVNFHATVSDLPFDVLDSYWPRRVAHGAREWVVHNIEGGRVTEGEVVVAIDPAMWTAEDLPAEAFDFRFAFSGITAHYLRPMPPIRGGSGSARLDAQSFRLQTSSGTTGGVRIAAGDLLFRDIHRAGGARAEIDLELAGETATILALIDHKPLGYPSAYGLDPTRVGGRARVDLKLAFPLIASLGLDDVEFAVDSRLVDLHMADILEDVHLSTPEMRLTVNRKGLRGEGEIALNQVPFALVWTENFDAAKGSLPSRFVLDGIVAGPGWDVLSLPLAPFIEGPAAISLVLEGEGPRIRRGQGRFDLRAAAMAFAELGWAKKAGEASVARFRFDKPNEELLVISDLVYQDASLKVSGSMTADDAGLRDMLVDNLQIGATHLAGVVSRTEGKSFAIAVTADSVDARPFIERLTKGGGDRGVMPDFTLDATAGKLTALGDVTLRDVVATATYENGRWSGGAVEGVFADRGKLNFILEPNAAEATRAEFKRRFTITSDNAAALARGLGLFDNIQGGTLDFRGLMSEPGADQLIEGRIRTRSFRLTEAPVLARILTIGSLTGIRDLLSGEGIRFDDMSVPFRLEKGIARIKDARAAGPAIGLTLNGEFSLVNHQAALSGTIVPAYAANSVLGKVPVLGSLLTGGKGQGVFALTYDVRGPVDDPQISVNPLAILTPGFLRGIFESDARLNEAQRQAPAQSGDGESGAEDAGTEEGE